LWADSLRSSSSKEMPATLDELVLRPALIAWFHVAHTFTKLIPATKVEEITFLRRGLENYRLVADYCARNPASTSVVTVRALTPATHVLIAVTDPPRSCGHLFDSGYTRAIFVAGAGRAGHLPRNGRVAPSQNRNARAHPITSFLSTRELDE
jgi:hypothetical protein